MISQAEIVETIEKFRKLVNETESIVKQCEMTINEADKAFGDIRHYCELNNGLESTKKTKICKLIKEYSAKRREAKDTLAVIEGLHNYIEQNKTFKGNIGYLANGAQKEWRFICGERTYVPRVLDELFEGEK